MYLLFAWPDYESRGGFNDFVGAFDTLEKAVEHVRIRKSARMPSKDEERVCRWNFENFQVVRIYGDCAYEIVLGNGKEINRMDSELRWGKK